MSHSERRSIFARDSQAGREIKILCGTLLCRSRASQRLLLPREAKGSRGLGEITLICKFFEYEVLSIMTRCMAPSGFNFVQQSIFIAIDIYPEAKRYIPPQQSWNALRSDNLFAQRDPS